MPLTPGGTRIGIYEVTALIGEGGPPSLAAPPPEHEIVMLQNFADELRRRVPPGK